MARLLMAFGRVCTRDQEDDLVDKFKELKSITPHNIGVGQYFTLDASTKIEEIFS